ncbi:MAG: DUF3086 domain-containing protein [Prochlorothrix sp.]
MTSENFPSPDQNADRTPATGQEGVPENRPLLNLGNARPQSSPEATALTPEPTPSAPSPPQAGTPQAGNPPAPQGIDPRLSQFEFPTEAQTPRPPAQPLSPSAAPKSLDLQDLETDTPELGQDTTALDLSDRPSIETTDPSTTPDDRQDDRQNPLGEFRYGAETEGFPLEAAAFSLVQGQNYALVGGAAASNTAASNTAASNTAADNATAADTALGRSVESLIMGSQKPTEDDPWADPVEEMATALGIGGDSLGSSPSGSSAGSAAPSPDRPPAEPAPSSPTTSPTPAASSNPSPASDPSSASDAAATLDSLQARKAQLQKEVADLEAQLELLQEELMEAKQALSTMIREASQELKERRQALKLSIEQLEQRQEKIQEEMKQNFAGASQELAVRVQSFKNFLVGSLQDLVVAADDLKLVPEAPDAPAASGSAATPDPSKPEAKTGQARTPRFAEQSFVEEAQEIQQLLDQYRNSPDYYGPPWQLRRTFEPIHADRVSNWFFRQGGRGAIRSLGGRTQNILVASAVVSILNYFYGEQLSALILANNPERLGEWRRGLQDCLGIARSDFGPNRGVALFEDPFPLAQRADRILRSGNLPLIIIDESETAIDLSVLQFPIWLAFARDPADRRSQPQEYF